MRGTCIFISIILACIAVVTSYHVDSKTGTDDMTRGKRSQTWVTFCTHRGYRIENGSAYKFPFPHCEECNCDEGILSCIGKRLTWPIPLPNQCKVKENVCEPEYVIRDDETQPCCFKRSEEELNADGIPLWPPARQHNYVEPDYRN